MSFQVGDVSLPSLLLVRLGFNIALSSLRINFLLALSHSFGLEVCPFFNHPNLQIFFWEQGCLLFHFLVSPLSLSLTHAHTHTCTCTRTHTLLQACPRTCMCTHVSSIGYLASHLGGNSWPGNRFWFLMRQIVFLMSDSRRL